MSNESNLRTRIDEKSKVEYVVDASIPKKNFLIEVTNACNSACIFCANRKMTRKKGQIDSGLLEKVLREAHELGVEEVGFYTTGEPLVCTSLEKYIELAKKIGFTYVYITTNGVLATEERVRNLIEHGLDSIKFSINATDREMYKLIHGKDDFNIVMNNLKNVYNYRKKERKKFKLYVSYIATRYSLVSREFVKNFFQDFCDEVVVLNVINQSGLTPEVDTMLRVNSDKADVDFKITLPCSMVFNTINISYEGYLTACCADFQNYLAYADLNEMSLAEAWNSSIIKELRKKHIEGNVCNTLCANCVYNTTIKPEPLVKKYATNFEVDKMFECDCLEKRINQYQNR